MRIPLIDVSHCVEVEQHLREGVVEGHRNSTLVLAPVQHGRSDKEVLLGGHVALLGELPGGHPGRAVLREGEHPSGGVHRRGVREEGQPGPKRPPGRRGARPAVPSVPLRSNERHVRPIQPQRPRGDTPEVIALRSPPGKQGEAPRAERLRRQAPGPLGRLPAH